MIETIIKSLREMKEPLSTDKCTSLADWLEKYNKESLNHDDKLINKVFLKIERGIEQKKML